MLPTRDGTGSTFRTAGKTWPGPYGGRARPANRAYGTRTTVYGVSGVGGVVNRAFTA